MEPFFPFFKRQATKKERLEVVLGPMKVKLDVEKAKKILDLKSDIKGHLVKGPLDSVLGFFNTQNGDLVIDINEIFSCFKPKNPKEFDEQITKVVCHEFWHVKQKEVHGKWFFRVRKIITFFLILLWVFSTPITTLIFALFEPNIYLFLIGSVLDIILFLKFALPVILMISYIVSPEEIGARRYAQKHYQDQDWLEVIKIEPASKEEMLNDFLQNIFPLVLVREQI